MNILAFETYLAGFLVAAYDDLSYHKTATQSTTVPHGEMMFGAGNAVDRNTLTCMRTIEIGRSSPDKTVWWKVDLDDVYSIYSINIIFKNYDGLEDRQRGRFAGFSLYVSNTGNIAGSTLCYKDGPNLPPLNFSTVCLEQGRYVIFYNERLDGAIYPDRYELQSVSIEMCEVIIQGCNKSGVYGRTCNMTCPTSCRNDTCHIQNGNCYTCKPGWTGISCEKKCKEGWFGENCSQLCSRHCRNDAVCNHVTGQCYKGCNSGWTGYMCEKECDDGTYGYNCVNNCSGHCLNNSPCNKQTGQCDKGCNPGYTNTDCSKICPSGHYGTNCSERCSGHCINNEPCDRVSGVCPNGCKDGYTGKLCNSSCVEGFFGINCSLRCPRKCIVCRHTDGYCSSCKERYHGRNCSLICFPNCKSDTCQQTDSLCTCDAGWMGDNCTKECDDGTYGFDCVNNCSSHCLNNSSCEKHNGHCKNGCNPGYTNLLCNEHVLRNSNDDKDISTSTIFLLESVTINVVFFTGCFVLIWGIYTKKVSILGFNSSCGKRSKHYADSVIKSDEDQHYQELGPPREEISITYQNTVLQ
nr:protein draper [Crassostrea gigas]